MAKRTGAASVWRVQPRDATRNYDSKVVDGTRWRMRSPSLDIGRSHAVLVSAHDHFVHDISPEDFGMDQHHTFVESEADRWFERNREALSAFEPERDPALRMLELYGLRPRSVVEIGAANGARVAEIHRRYGTRAVAVEPSRAAIADGRRRFAHVEYFQGVASDTGLTGTFELVIVNYVFHWIDRSYLFGAFAEIDRLVMDRGFLFIGDFAPSNFIRVHYHHLPEGQLFTYKQPYASVFLASGLYQQVAAWSGTYPVKDLHVEANEDERGGGWLLHKRLTANYVAKRFPGGAPPSEG